MKKKVIFHSMFVFAVFILFEVFQSCVNIKSEFPEMTVYRLKQETTQGTSAESIILDKSIYVKEFTVPTELMSEKIIVDAGASTTKFNYHQWVAPLGEMLTDFMITRFNRYKTFKKGVFDTPSMLPDLILECRVVNFRINNSGDKTLTNTIELTISANVFAVGEKFSGINQIMSEVYTKTIARADNTMNSAVNSFSRAASSIIDDMILDIKVATNSNNYINN